MTDREKYIIANQDGQNIIRHYGEVDGNTLKVRKNKNCTIYILDRSAGVN